MLSHKEMMRLGAAKRLHNRFEAVLKLHQIYILYITSTIKTQINIAPFLLLDRLGPRAIRALLKISAILLKYPTFEGSFLYFHGQKK